MCLIFIPNESSVNCFIVLIAPNQRQLALGSLRSPMDDDAKSSTVEALFGLT